MPSAASPQAETVVSVAREPAVVSDPGIATPAAAMLTEQTAALSLAPMLPHVGVGPVPAEEKRVAAAEPPPTPDKPFAAAVKAIREGFGLGARHAALLEVARII